MPALMTAQLPGAKKEMIDEMEPLLDEIRGQKGFVIHTNGPVPGGWRVVEVWDSQSDFEAWFENHVKPALQEGAPTLSIAFDDLNDVRLAG
jgi:quinol monooxygenase YgiN